MHPTCRSCAQGLVISQREIMCVANLAFEICLPGLLEPRLATRAAIVFGCARFLGRQCSSLFRLQCRETLDQQLKRQAHCEMHPWLKIPGSAERLTEHPAAEL